MNGRRTVHVACLSEAVSPVTHMQGKAGNESLIATEPVSTPHGQRVVPYLSGNAIRHRMVREPGWRWLIDRWGLEGRLSPLLLNFLLCGGARSEKGAKENTERVVAWWRICPLGALLGGSLPDQILSGSLRVWRGNLVCEDNRETLEKTLPPDVAQTLPAKLPPAAEFIGGYQYTRGDASGGTANLMIYSGSAVNRGAVFVHGFALTAGGDQDLELGALLWSLRLWQRDDGTFGGMAGRGHGRLALSIHIPDLPGIDQDALCQRYVEHATDPDTQAAALAWLAAAFPGGILAA